MNKKIIGAIAAMAAVIIGGVSGFIGYLFGKSKAEDSNELLQSNLVKSQELLRGLEEDSMSIILEPESEDEKILLDSIDELAGEVRCFYGDGFNRYIFSEIEDLILIRDKIF